MVMLLGGLVAGIVALVLVSGAIRVFGRPHPDGVESRAAADTDDTRLGQVLTGLVADHPGLSGIHALPDARAAFAARVAMIDAAERSIDAQYYIWSLDASGTLLFEAVWRAAERGVRVRLLIDDNTTSGEDGALAALAAHPNIRMRLYNPLYHRRLRWLNYPADFFRLNRRMHNKSMTVDNQVTVVGGRNIGDEYFGAGAGMWYRDLDAIGVGKIVPEVSAQFDLFWNSEPSVPADALLPRVAPGDAAERLEAVFAANREDPLTADYVGAVESTRFVQDLRTGQLPLEWTTVQLVHDDPAKTLEGSANRDVLLLSALIADLGRPSRSFDLVSPYFVPGTGGTAALVAMAQRGLRVRVLTNSMAATDVPAVHSGYLKRRRDLLEGGVHLLELEPTPGAREEWSLGGSSSASLHAKTFAVDGERIFIGSFNFDERSALLNTEMGLLIDSPSLAAGLVGVLDGPLRTSAYEVRLTADGEMEWVERSGADEQVWAREPASSLLRRALVRVMSWLPIEWLL